MPAMRRCHGRCEVRPLRPNPLPPGTATASVRLLIGGLGCENCAVRVRNALVSLDGVADALVCLTPPVASVTYDPARVDPEDLVAAVAKAGDGSRHEYSAVRLESARSR